MGRILEDQFFAGARPQNKGNLLLARYQGDEGELAVDVAQRHELGLDHLATAYTAASTYHRAPGWRTPLFARTLLGAFDGPAPLQPRDLGHRFSRMRAGTRQQ